MNVIDFCRCVFSRQTKKNEFIILTSCSTIFVTVTDNNTAETKQIFRLSYKKLSKENQSKKEQMPMMSPHVNSQEELSSQPAAQSTQNQQVQQTPLQVQTGNNQSTPPSQSVQQPQHTRKYQSLLQLQ